MTQALSPVELLPPLPRAMRSLNVRDFFEDAVGASTYVKVEIG